MSKVALFFVAAATLVGCASTRQESAAAIQAELPQLVTACNGAFRDGSQLGLGIVVISQGIDACDRLAHGQSLGLVRPTTAELYRNYRLKRTNDAANRAGVALAALPESQTWPNPVDAAAAAIHDASASFPAACTSSAPFGC